MSIFVSGLLLALAPLAAAPPAAGAGPLDDVTRVRALLAAGQEADAAQVLRLDEEVPRFPGLSGPLLEAKGDEGRARACALYESDAARNPARQAAAALRAARCLAPLEGAPDRASRLAKAFQAVLSDGTLGRDVLVAVEAERALDRLPEAPSAVQALAGWVVDTPPEPSDVARREAHAELVRGVAQRTDHDELRQRALRVLYVDLAETKATAELLAEKPKWAKTKVWEHKDRSLALERAEVLSRRNATDELLATLGRWAPKARDLSDEACHVRLLTGKARRNQRRYQASRNDLDVVAEKCGEPWRKKARYLAARVATFQGAKDAEAVLDRFLEAYPKDSLTDDVLVWKAELFKHQGRFDEADAAYARVAADHPTGDMLHGARFDRAFLRAQRGDTDGAVRLLEEIARTSVDGVPIVSDQALYWSARLTAFPDLKSWTLTDDVERRQAGLRALLALAQSRPASFYGHLAGQVVRGAAPRAGLTDEQLALPGRDALRRGQGQGPVSWSDALAAEPRFAAARALAEGGYLPEAAVVLDGIDVGAHRGAPRDLEALAALYAVVGRLDRSHQVMRNAGLALPPGKPTGTAAAAWSLAFPRAHAVELASAATQAGLPPAVMLGLSREESAFDASVVSWAGAIGLCQLMPSTAKEEAQLAGVKGVPDLDALRQPALNARLGANHLARRWKQLKHPLLAIAAYNAGPGRVKGWVKASAAPVDTWVEEITVEQTRNYVKKVTGSWVAYSLLDAGTEAEVSYPLEVK